jgi:hypothetical protein
VNQEGVTGDNTSRNKHPLIQKLIKNKEQKMENFDIGKYKWLIVLAVIVLLVVIVYSSLNSLRNDGIIMERQLGAQYQDNQNWLSAYVSGFYEKVGLANAQTDAFDRVLTDAVKGRYDKDGFSADGAFFAAVVEAYPDQASLMAAWNSIQDYVTAGREGYRNQQSKLLDMLRSYDTWRETGFIKSTVIRILGFPSKSLEARVGEITLTGEFARQKMYQIVLASDAINAYQTGIMDPLQVNP